jgi:hypothetical protein
MILFKRPKILFFVAWLVVAGAPASDVDLEKALGSLIAAEKAYAKAAGEKGFREASISAFADDAVIFTPDPVNGKKFWQQTKEDPVIIWRPTFAAIARSGISATPRVRQNSATSEPTHRLLPAPVGAHVVVASTSESSDGVWKIALDLQKSASEKR